MDFRDIDVSKIQSKKNKLYYYNKRIFILLPKMKCITGIEKYYNRYQIILDFGQDNKDFYEFIKRIETNNKKFCAGDAQYKSQIRNNTIILKIPFRYNKFEVTINSEDIYLPTTSDVKSGNYMTGVLEIGNVWNYDNEGEKICGCLMQLKEIN